MFVRFTFAVLVQWIIEEASDPVWGNGKWYSCCNFQGVDADYLSVLKLQTHSRLKAHLDFHILRWFFSKENNSLPNLQAVLQNYHTVKKAHIKTGILQKHFTI